MEERVNKLTVAVEDIMAGKATWPRPNLATDVVDYSQFATASKEDIINFVNSVLVIMGHATEMVTIMTGYWGPTLADKDIKERGEKIVKLHMK